MNAATLEGKDNPIAPRLYIAMELSNKQWKVVFGDGVRRRRVTVEAGCREQLREALAKAKEKFDLSEAVPVVSCYEAGRDGFLAAPVQEGLELLFHKLWQTSSGLRLNLGQKGFEVFLD